MKANVHHSSTSRVMAASLIAVVATAGALLISFTRASDYRVAGTDPVDGPEHCAARVYQAGSAGMCVLVIQQLLVKSNATLKPDGQFGKATAEAVTTFQKTHGLMSAPGIVDKATWVSLLTASKN